MRRILTPVYVNSTAAQPALPPLNGVYSQAAPLSQSLAANFTTVASNLENLDSAAYQIQVTTSDSSGSFYFQMSNDGVSFIDVATCGSVAAANDSILVEIDISRAALYCRLKYVSSVAGTGTCTMSLVAKQVGG